MTEREVTVQKYTAIEELTECACLLEFSIPKMNYCRYALRQGKSLMEALLGMVCTKAGNKGTLTAGTTVTSPLEHWHIGPLHSLLLLLLTQLPLRQGRQLASSVHISRFWAPAVQERKGRSYHLALVTTAWQSQPNQCPFFVKGKISTQDGDLSRFTVVEKVHKIHLGNNGRTPQLSTSFPT